MFADETTTGDLLHQIRLKLPKDWSTMEPELQLHHLLLSADEVLKPGGDFILLNANLTVRELLQPDEPKT